MAETKYTLDQLKKIAQKGNLSLPDLQARYGVYEFTFATCAEARDGFHFPSTIDGQDKDPKDSKLIAYYDAWKKISLSECPNVTKLTFEESIAFMRVCYGSGKQLDELLVHILNLTGTDIAKIVVARQAPQTISREHNYFSGPLNDFHEALAVKVENHYNKRINVLNRRSELVALLKQANTEYKLRDIRPYPKFFSLLYDKIIKRTYLLSDLISGPYSIERWRELCKNLPIKDIFPTLEKSLSVVMQNDRSLLCRKKGGGVWNELRWVFAKCETTEQAHILLQIGRPYFSGGEDQSDVLYELYDRTCERIVTAHFPKHPKLADFIAWKSQVERNTWPFVSEFQKKWKAATEKALKQPIHSFGRLHYYAHESLKQKVLDVWNAWGMKQMEGLMTWDEISHFPYKLLAWPDRRHGPSGHYHIWPSNKSYFYAFSEYVSRIISVAQREEDLDKVLNLLMNVSSNINECSGCSFFYTAELITVLQKYIALGASKETLLKLYDKMNSQGYIRHRDANDILFDRILEIDPSVIDIVLGLTQGYPSYSKYFDFKVERLAGA